MSVAFQWRAKWSADFKCPYLKTVRPYVTPFFSCAGSYQFIPWNPGGAVHSKAVTSIVCAQTARESAAVVSCIWGVLQVCSLFSLAPVSIHLLTRSVFAHAPVEPSVRHFLLCHCTRWFLYLLLCRPLKRLGCKAYTLTFISFLSVLFQFVCDC